MAGCRSEWSNSQRSSRAFLGWKARADRMVRRWIGYLALLGALWALLFCAGYYVVKRLSAHPA